MGASQRRKGTEAEREVVNILREIGLPAVRTPNSGGLHVRGDLTGVPGYHFEVKRQEVLRIPLWIGQAALEAPEGDVPVVVWRTNRCPWQADLPFAALAKLLDLARLAG